MAMPPRLLPLPEPRRRPPGELPAVLNLAWSIDGVGSGGGCSLLRHSADGDERVVLTEMIVNPCSFFNIDLIFLSYLIIVPIDDTEADIWGPPLATSAHTYAY
jgi:hypothetical protein